jgi:hypothetical protein
MVQTARNITMEEWGFLTAGQYLLHGQGQLVLVPASRSREPADSSIVVCQERLGGLLKYYDHQAA